MKNILVIGAGRSAYCLIEYLHRNMSQEGWQVTVADALQENLDKSIPAGSDVKAQILNVENDEQRRNAIDGQDVVISMMPARLHFLVALDALAAGAHLLTASYLKEDIESLDPEAQAKGLLFLGEMGLDPGIDHMSAMQLIHRVREAGHTISAFRSYTGGLIAAEHDDNPWHYKFTWNPYNVIRAGQGVARYVADNSYRFVPYYRLFQEVQPIDAKESGRYEAYLNRDSLPYIQKYGLAGISTFLRGTIRYEGFSRGWNYLVQLGLTDDHHVIADSDQMTYRQWLEMHLPPGKGDTRTRLAQFLGLREDSADFKRLEWLGLLDEMQVGLEDATSGMVLQYLLERKWAMDDNDRDRVVMVHELEWEEDGQLHLTKSVMDLEGANTQSTAMAKTVGYPLGIAAKLLLQGKLKATGVTAPLQPEIYEPVLKELEANGVEFKEYEEL